jgi:hypothetical protein
MIFGIFFIAAIVIFVICAIFVPGMRAYNTTNFPISESGLIFSDNGGINKSKGIKGRLIMLFILVAVGITCLIVGANMRSNAPESRVTSRQSQQRREQALEEARIVTNVGIGFLALSVPLILYNIIQNKRVRSSIFVHDDYLTGLASWGVTYRLTYDQVTAIETLKNDKVLVLCAAGRNYNVWVSRCKATWIQSLILEQRDKISREKETVFVNPKCSCGHDFQEGEKFCMNCGSAPIVVIHPTCSCGFIFKGNAKFCTNCGSPPPVAELELKTFLTCSCGYEYQEEEKFCRDCGASLVV